MTQPDTLTGHPVPAEPITTDVRNSRRVSRHRFTQRHVPRAGKADPAPANLIRHNDTDIRQPLPSRPRSGCPASRNLACPPSIGESRYGPAPTPPRPGKTRPRRRNDKERDTSGLPQPCRDPR